MEAILPMHWDCDLGAMVNLHIFSMHAPGYLDLGTDLWIWSLKVNVPWIRTKMIFSSVMLSPAQFQFGPLHLLGSHDVLELIQPSTTPKLIFSFCLWHKKSHYVLLGKKLK